MKNVLSIAKREFRSAFDLPIAYVFIAAFLILAALGGLLGFFDRGVSDLRDYFQGLRYAFVLFAPAVSMRLWAEERRSRTFELLFTLPVKPWEAVLGKFLGALGLVVVAVALGGVLPLTLSKWAKFDAGAVAAGYLGVLLLAAAEIALGLLVSALTDNQIVAFVGAAVLSFLLLIAGEPSLVAEAERLAVSESLTPVKKALVGALARVGTGEHQDALARGVLDTRDLVYFFALTALFLFANVVAVERRRGRVEAGLAVLLGVSGFFLAEDVATRRHARLDLTSRGAFSLHEGTKAALSGIEARLTIRCYLSRDLPAAEERRKRTLLDFLGEVEAQGGKNVRLELYDPRGDEKLVEQAKREGIMSVRRQHADESGAESKIIWCGISLLYAGKPPVAIPFALYQDNLEYDVAVAVRKLLQKDAQRIAWIELAQQKGGFAAIRGELARSYTVETVDLAQRAEIAKDYRTAVLVLDQGANASGALTDRALYELDQFIMRGGALLVLVDPVRVEARSMRATPLDWAKVAKTLERWGIAAPPRVVLSLSPPMLRWTIPSPSAQQLVSTDQFAYFVEPSSLTNRGSPVAAQTGRGYFAFTGEVACVASGRAGTTATALVKTAPDSWTLEGTLDLDPLRIPLGRVREPKTIAAAISGEIPSAFDAPVPPTKPGADPLAERVASTKAGRLVVFGNSDFIRDATREHLARMHYEHAFDSNATIFLNTIEWASQDVSLSSMRARSGSEPLQAKTDELEKARGFVWGVNLIGMPLLVGVAGVARFFLRRRAGGRAATRSRQGSAA